MSPASKTILSVDDSLTIRKLIENALRPAGYEVLQAATGQEGLDMARERQPDLILLDYVLPDLRGVEFCQRLQAEESTRTMPVLLISGHGSAIQELSHDCANVVDYLTKPFASNILQAVVANVFEKKIGARNAASPEPSTPAPAPSGAPSPPPAVVAHPPAEVAPAAEAELRRRVFERLIARLHPALPSVPAWEAARGEAEPLSYYLSRLLPLDFINELAGELTKVAPPARAGSIGGGGGVNGHSPLADGSSLSGTTRFVSERHVLSHLNAEGATGELRLTLAEEAISVWFDAGAIVAISSNHPRFYCAGSSYPFLQVPHAAVSAAMVAQRDAGVPFFVTAAARGVRPEGVDLPETLRECGHRCLGRVYAASECRFAFTALAAGALPAYAQGEFGVRYSLPQLLLESYRTASDWQHVQQAVPRLELYVGRTGFDETHLGQLTLNVLETELLTRMDFRHTVAQLQEILNRPLFEVCRAIYCLARLDLCYLSDLPMEEAEDPGSAPGPDADHAPATAVSDAPDLPEMVVVPTDDALSAAADHPHLPERAFATAEASPVGAMA